MDVVTPEQARIAEVSLGLGKAMPGTIPKEPRGFVAWLCNCIVGEGFTPSRDGPVPNTTAPRSGINPATTLPGYTFGLFGRVFEREPAKIHSPVLPMWPARTPLLTKVKYVLR